MFPSLQAYFFHLGQAREITSIEIPPVRYSYRPNPDGDIGYIRINQFTAIAVQEMREAIKDLEKKQVSGYVLDLRSNSGGLVNSSIEITRMWLDAGTIVSTVDRRGTTKSEAASNHPLTDKPLIILVDGGTASGSEILAAALQDNQRAMLVGTQTFGSNSIQLVKPLQVNDTGIAVTITKWLTPNGRDISQSGLTPDVIVGLTVAQKEALIRERSSIGTTADPQYAKAMEVLTQVIRQKNGQQ